MRIGTREWLLMLIVMLSAWYLFSPVFFKENGVFVVSLDEYSMCGDIKVGDRIVQVGSHYINSVEDFGGVLESYETGERVTMVVNWGPGGCTAIGDGDIGMDVEDVPTKRVKFGLDVYGGKRVRISVDDATTTESINEIKSILEERAKILGVSQINIDVDEGGLFIETLDVSELSPLLVRGYLEGRIEQQIKVVDGVGQIKLGPEYYDLHLPFVETPVSSVNPPNVTDGNYSIEETIDLNVSLSNDTSASNLADVVSETKTIITDHLIFDGNEYVPGESFKISDIEFKVLNITNSSIVLSGFVFNNSDIALSEFAGSYVRYESGAFQYQFFVPVDVSDDASQRFSKIVGGMSSFPISGTSILEGALGIYIDGNEVNKLTMPASMADREIKSLNIIGTGPDVGETTIKKMEVEVALVGNIDYDISIDEITDYRPGGGWMLDSTIVGILVFSLILFLTPPVVYKHENWFEMSAWSSLLIIVVAFVVFGVAAASQSIFKPGWILDGGSILGILVVGAWVFIWSISAPERILKRRKIRLLEHLDLVFIFFGFVLLFTNYTGVGISLIVGCVLKLLFSDPIYKNILNKI